MILLVKFDAFISKEMFKNLAGCIVVAEGCTESIKILFHLTNRSQLLWLAFIFSCLVSLIKYWFDSDRTKDQLILCGVNVIPIFLGLIGSYQVAVKPLEKFLFGGG